MNLVLRFDIARIAVAKRIGHRMPLGIETHIIHCPAICSNRSDALRRELGTAAKPFLHPGTDSGDVPAESTGFFFRRVGKTVNDFYAGSAVNPPQQGSAAAFRPQIDGDEDGAGADGERIGLT